MRNFLSRISSRKFLAATAVQLASVLAVFWPAQEETIHSTAVRVAALTAMLLAALGYGSIEASLDAQAQKPSTEVESQESADSEE